MKWLKLIGCIVGIMLLAAAGSFATASSVYGWFNTLVKPSFNPPNYLFGPVWTLLYVLMGVGLYLILQSTSETKRRALFIFVIQMVLNVAWSFIFFYFREPGWAFVEIILLWFFIISMIIVYSRINKWAAWLQTPYLAWVTFASVLNGSLWYLNK